MSYVSVPLRRLVTQRAEEQCEYCRYPQAASFFTFEIEHIIAEKHDGITEAENPRIQQWSDHFRLQGGNILPLTPEGRVTAKILQFNLQERVIEREQLISIGKYPVL
jgi:hypothetical protein